MHRSRTGQPVPWPAVLLALVLVALAACGLIRAAGVATGGGDVVAPAAVSAQGPSDASGLLPASATVPAADGEAVGGGCSKTPTATEGSPSPRIESDATNLLFIAEPPATGRAPADRHATGCAASARSVPITVLLSVLRI